MNSSERVGVDNVILLTKPYFREFCLYEKRMESFIKYIWPIGLKQRPNELSQGGFFYSGESDKVTCFYCGGGLQNWDPKDDVWEEHAKWWPKCGFLILNKSTKYIESFHSPTDFIHEENTLTKMYLSLLEFFQGNRTGVRKSTSLFSSKSSNPSIKIQTYDEVLKENNILKDEKLCKICMTKKMDVVIIPCGHFVSCSECITSLENCPFCRSSVKAVVKTFLS